MAATPFARRVDPRTKLALQIAFVAAAFAHTAPAPLAVLTALTVGVMWLSGMAVRSFLSEVRFLIAFLALAPVLAGLHVGPPWLDVAAARDSGLAAYRVLLLVAVGLALVRTTPPREVRGAIAWLLPGRSGRAVGTGVALVFRFLPLLRGEARQTREAMRVRLAARRPVHDRMRLLGIVVLVRMFARADRIAMALRARCLAWNPTDPGLTFGRADLPALALVVVLVGWALA